MKDENRNRRRIYFIDKSFQTSFIMRFCLLLCISGLLSGALIYWANMQTTTVAFENMRVVVKSTSDFILPITLQVLAAVAVLVGIATVVVTLLTSHKIAGPLYRLKKELMRLKEGNLVGKIVPRSDDQLKAVVGELEALREQLDSSIGSIKEAWEPIQNIAKEASDAISDDKIKQELKEKIQIIEEKLTRYKTS